MAFIIMVNGALISPSFAAMSACLEDSRNVSGYHHKKTWSMLYAERLKNLGRFTLYLNVDRFIWFSLFSIVNSRYLDLFLQFLSHTVELLICFYCIDNESNTGLLIIIECLRNKIFIIQLRHLSLFVHVSVNKELHGGNIWKTESVSKSLL